MKFDDQFCDILMAIVDSIDDGRMAMLLSEDTNTQEKIIILS